MYKISKITNQDLFIISPVDLSMLKKTNELSLRIDNENTCLL